MNMIDVSVNEREVYGLFFRSFGKCVHVRTGSFDQNIFGFMQSHGFQFSNRKGRTQVLSATFNPYIQ